MKKPRVTQKSLDEVLGCVGLSEDEKLAAKEKNLACDPAIKPSQQTSQAQTKSGKQPKILED